jgi:hypothetical protein
MLFDYLMSKEWKSYCINSLENNIGVGIFCDPKDPLNIFEVKNVNNESNPSSIYIGNVHTLKFEVSMDEKLEKMENLGYIKDHIPREKLEEMTRRMQEDKEWDTRQFLIWVLPKILIKSLSGMGIHDLSPYPFLQAFTLRQKDESAVLT